MKYLFSDPIQSDANVGFSHFVEYKLDKDNALPRKKYFESRELAQAWIDRLKDFDLRSLPLGVTFDIRKGTKPFLARFRKGKGNNQHAWFGNVKDAAKWLKKNRDGRK